MVINRENKKIFILIALFILCLSFIPAQEQKNNGGTNYFVDRSGDELRFIQRIIWEESDYFLHYEVVIEKMEQKVYVEVERFRSEVNFIEVSLASGHYRYKVEVYNLFDELSFTTEWSEFEIILAFQPSIAGFSPNGFHLDEDHVWEITLQGQNLFPESEFYLVQDDKIIRPLHHTVNDNNATLVFSRESLVRGKFSICVRNPGGLDARLGDFTIKANRTSELVFSIGYAPILPLYGYLFKDAETLEAPFSGGFYPLGIAAKVSFIPFIKSWGNLGIEISCSLAFLEQDLNYYTTSASLLNTHLGIMYQKYFMENAFSINVSIGAGITSVLDFHYKFSFDGHSTENITTHYPSGIIGVSFFKKINNIFTINAGFDFIHIFSPPTDRPMPGFIRPFVTAGIQL
ncbi:MAG: hypothetical protein LBU88_09600 [Treponema sp.]|jgi:hypothetical protein|nr:hypothetical protein [Treponema sp.]